MSYSKTNWTNNSTPAINADNLNKIEQGIYDNDAAISSANTNIGTLTNLTTTEKSNLVGAINEVDSNTDINTTNIGDLSDLETTAQTDIVSAINENVDNIGDLTTLTTTANTDLVSAINELNSLKATKDVATTSANGLMSASDKTKLDNGEVYSTTETRIGTWIDGKPLYRKVVTKTFSDTIGPSSFPGITYEIIDHGISNIRTFVKCTCILNNINGNSYKLPVMGYDANLNRPQFTSVHNFNSTTIGLRICNDTWSTNNTFYFECLYTKTTD